jgi:hypothetical protein
MEDNNDMYTIVPCASDPNKLTTFISQRNRLGLLLHTARPKSSAMSGPHVLFLRSIMHDTDPILRLPHL